MLSTEIKNGMRESVLPSSSAPTQPINQDEPWRPEPLRSNKMLEFGVFLSVFGAVIAFFLALDMQQVTDAMVCIFGSVTGCAMSCYFYFRRD